MRVLVAVYGSVGGVSFGPGIVRVLEGGVSEATDSARLGGHRCRQGASLDLSDRPERRDGLVGEGGQRRGAILDAIGGVLARAEEVIWGVDVTGTMSGLLLALLAAHGQRVRYVPGRTVNQMASAYRGEAKTDARDAYVIAETLRHRGDLAEVEVATSLVTELRLLVTHRTDLVGDRVRMVNRLRDVLSGYFPGHCCVERSRAPGAANPPVQA